MLAVQMSMLLKDVEAVQRVQHAAVRLAQKPDMAYSAVNRAQQRREMEADELFTHLVCYLHILTYHLNCDLILSNLSLQTSTELN